MTAAAVAAYMATAIAGAQLLVTVSDDTRIRTGPSEEHNRLCVLPAGVPLWALGKRGDWYHLRLCPSLDAWVFHATVRPTGRTRPLEPARLRSVAARGSAASSEVAFTLTRPVAFRVTPILSPPTLVVDLFDCHLAAYWVRQFADDEVCKIVQPWQEAAAWVRVRIELLGPAIVGYSSYYRGEGELVIDVRRPYETPTLAGKVVVLDPGHGGKDRGAGGVNGIEEKTLNLSIATRAAELLVGAGARVILTRRGDVQVGPPGCSLADELHARLMVGVKNRADLFVSIHNNWLSKPARGTEAYYWTAFSQPLARYLLGAVARALGTPARYVGWRPFGVLRATDCPRALVECAYMSDKDEAEYMRRPEFSERAARGIVAGIASFVAGAAHAGGS